MGGAFPGKGIARVLRALASAALLLGAVTPAWAGWRSEVRTNNDSKVDILVSSPVQSAPDSGCVPVWVTIKNRSGSTRTWQITGEQNNYVRTSSRPAAVQNLQVRNDETARAALLLPLEVVPNGTSHYSQINVRVEGYGVEDASVSMPSHSSGGSDEAYIGLGAELATPMWGSLEKAVKDHGSELNGSPVDVSLLPTDWRGLSGFDCLALTETEYTGLDADRRGAIRDWLNQGGHLLIYTPGLAPTLRTGLGLPAEGSDGYPGFGRVRLIPWDGKTPPDAEALRTTFEDVDYKELDGSFSDATDWGMTHDLGSVPVNAAFLIGFISVFALVIGPVNLFLWADSKRRHRLFWTTPLIATAASLLLMGVILFQDGFGGHGARSTVTLLLPDQRKAVVVQEQVSRSGVLLTGRFTTGEDLILSQLKASGSAAKSYQQVGRSYSGDWFTSHNVQAQRAEAIVPSRAEVQVATPAGADPNAPPTVISSIPTTLKEIYYTDPAGHQWHGQNLHTGEKLTLKDDPTRPPLGDLGGSQLLSERQKDLTRPGYFHAVAEKGPFFDTLGSIHWRSERAVYLGPVTFAR